MSQQNQSFASFADWRQRAVVEMTARGTSTRAACYDALGRRCDSMEDFERARDENAFPVRWVWPDQLADALGEALRSGIAAEGRLKEVERLAGLDGMSPYVREMAERNLGWIANACDAQRRHVEAHHAGIDASHARAN